MQRHTADGFRADRWTAYRDTGDGWICVDGRRAAPYAVQPETDVVSPFATILRGVSRLDDEDVVPRLCAFYRDFGLLGYTSLSGQPHRVKCPDGRPELREGDRIDWVLAHVVNVGLILALAHERRAALDRRLATISAEAARLRIPTVAPSFVSLSFDVAEAQHDASPLEVARRLLAELLNPNLVGVARMYDAEADVPRFHFRALIEVLYWQLADRLAGRTQIRRCPCGALFFAQDPRQKHCPPRPGRRESACTKRFNMRRLRRRH